VGHDSRMIMNLILLQSKYLEKADILEGIKAVEQFHLADDEAVKNLRESGIYPIFSFDKMIKVHVYLKVHVQIKTLTTFISIFINVQQINAMH
jgi:hypothetical protein